jgi:type II secretory pathway pseudopilin PulG
MNTRQVQYTQKSKQVGALGFTVVELLVSLAVISVLVGMTLVALSGAQKDAEVARTRATIRKISGILEDRISDYAYRQVAIPINSNLATPFDVAQVRLIALRDLLRTELPDRATDIAARPTTLMMCTQDATSPLVNIRIADSTTSYTELRRYFGLGPWFPNSAYSPSTPDRIPPRNGKPATIDNPELLYAIVSTTFSNGQGGLESFLPSEIADTDSDGWPEFIDAWGSPIWWLRWPYGARSWSFRLKNTLALWVDGDETSLDSLDVMRVDWRHRDPLFPNPAFPSCFDMPPLVISAGPDRELNIMVPVVPVGSNDWNDYAETSAFRRYASIGSLSSPYHRVNPQNYVYPDPYCEEMGGGVQDPNKSSHQDNVTNFDVLDQ